MNFSLPASKLNSNVPVLIINADRDFCGAIASYLGEFGYSVDVAYTGPTGLSKALTQPCHAVILDLILPGINGFDLLKRIRQSSAVPVLIVADQANEANEVAGLEGGADDHLLKGSSARQLLARLRAITRRATLFPANASIDRSATEITVAELRIVPDARSVTLDGRMLSLTPSEYEILLSLVKANGRVKTRDHLFAEIFDREYEVFDRSLDVQVSALRRKLGDDPQCPRFIRTVRSIGYMFIEPPRRLPIC